MGELPRHSADNRPTHGDHGICVIGIFTYESVDLHVDHSRVLVSAASFECDTEEMSQKPAGTGVHSEPGLMLVTP